MLRTASVGQNQATLLPVAQTCALTAALPATRPPRRQQKDTSPLTGERLAHKLLVPNVTLRSAMQEVAEMLRQEQRGCVAVWLPRGGLERTLGMGRTRDVGQNPTHALTGYV